MKTTRIICTLAALALLALGCDSEDDNGTDDMGTGGSGGMADVDMAASGGTPGDGVPAPFNTYTNPVADDADALAAGEGHYAMACAGCHAADGTGDGIPLNPIPSAFTVDQSGWSDGYLYWRITTADSGPAGTGMPAYDYDEAKVWELVTYLRAFGS